MKANTRSIACAAAVALCACATAPPPKGKAPLIPERAAGSWGEDLAPDVKAYLEQLHDKKLHRAWFEDVVRKAANWLPADDPANDLSRVAEVEVRLDPRGQPREVRLVASSRHEPFDESALRALRSISPYPPLPPSLAERRVALRWRLHRDGRLCAPSNARVLATPMAPDVALRALLEAGRLPRALEVVREHARGERAAAIAEVLATAGLASADPAAQTLAVRLAAVPALERMLWETRDKRLWDAALARLTARKVGAPLAALLAAAGVPASVEARRRVLALLEALRTIGHAVPAKTLAPLLASKVPELVIAAADLAGDADPLRVTLQAQRQDPEVAGALAVRLRSLTGPDGELDATIKAALAGAGALPTLRALCRNRVPELGPAVSGAYGRAKSVEARVATLQALACLDAGLGRVYAALQAREQPVQLAALAALERSSQASKRARAFRLADLVLRGKGAVRRAALAALQQLGPLQDVGLAPALVASLKRIASHEATAAPASAPASAPAEVTLVTVLRAACDAPAVPTE